MGTGFHYDSRQPNQEMGPAGLPAIPLPQADQSPGVMDYAGDAALGVVGGARDAVQETTDFVHSAVNWVDDLIGTDAISNETPNWLTLPEVHTDTIAGDITRGITQFAVGFVGAGKFLKAAKLAGKLGSMGTAALKGALSDAVVFDPHEERFSNLIEQFPSLQNPVTDFFAADLNDSEAEGRLKNALEGLMLGGAVDLALKGIRALKLKKAIKGADDTAGIEKAKQAEADLADELSKRESAGPGADPGKVYKDINEAEPGLVAKSHHTPDGMIDTLLEEAKKAAGSGQITKQLWDKVYDKTLKSNPAYLNTARFNSAHDVLEFIDRSARKLAPHFDTSEVRTAAAVEKDLANLMDKVGGSPDMWKADLEEGGLAMLDAKVKLGDQLLQKMGDDIMGLTNKLELGNGTKRDQVALLMTLDKFAMITDAIKNTKTKVARTMRSFAFSRDAVDTIDISRVDEVATQFGGEHAIRKLTRRIKATHGDPKKMVKLSQGGLLDMANETFINSILSGPVTHMVNGFSNLLKTVTMPAEMAIGGLVTGNHTAVREAGRMLVGFKQYIRDSFDAAWTSVRMDDNILDPAERVLEDARHAVNSQNMAGMGKAGEAMMKSKGARQFVDGFGAILRTPTRFMMGVDEFFKQINYRSHLAAKAHTSGIGRGLKGDDLSKFIVSQVEGSFDKAGRGLASESIEYARQITFMQALEDGMGKSLQSFVNKMPIMRQIAPFIRTPTNIIRDAFDHTPIIGKNMREMKYALEQGTDGKYLRPELAASARGKMVVGKMFWGASALAVGTGTLTGGGPRDPKLRRNLLATGWRPYSIKIGDDYISYQRLEPFGTIMGLAADFGDIMRYKDGEDMDKLAGALVASLASNITSKTYLKGLIDTAGVLNEPDRNGERWVQQQVTARLPFSSLMRQTRSMPFVDPNMREARTIMDSILNTIPGFSQTLAPKRSWVTGEEVLYPDGSWSPFPRGKHKNNMVLDELVNLKHGFDAPRRSIEGVEFSNKQYSRLMELHGNVEINGKTMLGSLEEAMNSDYYDLERRKPDPPSEFTSHRLKMTTSIMGHYRALAKATLLLEDDDLAAKVTTARQQKMAALMPE